MPINEGSYVRILQTDFPYCIGEVVKLWGFTGHGAYIITVKFCNGLQGDFYATSIVEASNEDILEFKLTGKL